ncbi:MAG: hypothetical protein DRI46_12705 [Chloroflexi bacterium]|nr:MAG: hypothetical protein DRI46_12705 [Chloroflexota bacterium]
MSSPCFVCLQQFEKDEFIKARGTNKHFAFCIGCWDKYSKDELIALVVGNLKDKAVPKDVRRRIKKMLKRLSRGRG